MATTAEKFTYAFIGVIVVGIATTYGAYRYGYAAGQRADDADDRAKYRIARFNCEVRNKDIEARAADADALASALEACKAGSDAAAKKAWELRMNGLLEK